MRAFFFPSYMSGGFGHIGRCLALAEALERRGWETAFALAGPHLERVQNSSGQRTVYELRRPFRPRPERDSRVAYTMISGMDYQLIRDGLTRPSIITASVAEQFAAVKGFRPQVIIGDTWPLANVVARLAGVPVVQIVRAITHPDGPGVVWWQKPPSGLVPPDPKPVLNSLLEDWGLDPIERTEDLLRGDLYLAPSLPELDPLAGAGQLHYTGPFLRSSSEAIPEWLKNLADNQPVVYATMGGGAAGVGGVSFYKLLVEALRGLDMQVVVSTGARMTPADLPEIPNNFHVESWVPGPAVIARSQLVLYSGGYGTSMEVVRLGKPSLAIPFHSEQESNARRLEALGAARVLLPSGGAFQPVWLKGPGGKYSILVKPEFDLTADRLRSAVLEALDNPSLLRAAEELGKRSRQYGGQEQAADLVEQFVKDANTHADPVWNRLSWWQKLILQR